MTVICLIMLAIAIVLFMCLPGYQVVYGKPTIEETRELLKSLARDIEDGDDSARENIVVKLKNTKLSPTEEWTYTQKKPGATEESSSRNKKG